MRWLLLSLLLSCVSLGTAQGFETDGWIFHFGEEAVPVSGCYGSIWEPAQFPDLGNPGWLVACDGEPNPPTPPYTGL